MKGGEIMRPLFPVSVKRPITVMSYNSKEGYWESSINGIKVIAWLDLDKEEFKCTLNLFSVDEKGNFSKKGIGNINAITWNPIGFVSVATYSTRNNLCTFSLEKVCPEDMDLDNFNTFPILIWSMSGKWNPLFIPDREELYSYKPELNEESSSYIDVIADIHRKERLEQAQEQKEQTEREWDEWEENQK